jgi:DNA-binding GntR family transcriptional regulator
MKARGWRSRTTVEKARHELERTGWIVRTGL